MRSQLQVEAHPIPSLRAPCTPESRAWPILGPLWGDRRVSNLGYVGGCSRFPQSQPPVPRGHQAEPCRGADAIKYAPGVGGTGFIRPLTQCGRGRGTVARKVMLESRSTSPPLTVSCVLPEQGPSVLRVTLQRTKGTGERTGLCSHPSPWVSSGAAGGQRSAAGLGAATRPEARHSPSSLVWM